MKLAKGSPLRVVLHPKHGPGLDVSLQNIADIELLTPADRTGVIEGLGLAPALVTFEWDSKFLTPELRWVQAISAGLDQFPLEELREAGVILTSARGVHTPSVAEHAVALLFAMARRLGPAVKRMADRRWKPESATEVRKMTVTILGLGSIGTEIAGMLGAIGVRVIGVRSRATPSDSVDRVYGPTDLVSACAESDALICALPEGPETRGLVTTEHLDALGTGWVINVGRGSTIDEDALVDALTVGRLRGAALDVTEVEPLPDDSILWGLDNVIITPHMAWATEHLNPRLVELISHNVGAAIGERDWRNRVL